jgi:phage repressor protein C with HTH and peptisase S24 domain
MARKEEIVEIVREDGPVRRNDIAEKLPIKANYAGTLLSELADEDPPRLKRVVRNGKKVQGLYNLPERVGELNSTSLPDSASHNNTVEYSFLPGGLGAGDESLPVDWGEKMRISEQLLRAELGRVPPPSKAYWTRVNGESMEPYLQDGSPILVERTEDGVEAAGRYALLIDDVGGVVKRCERVGSETLRVASDNPSFPTRIYTHEGNEHYEDGDGNVLKIRVQGRVVYPRDTPHAMQEKAIHDIARALRQSTGQS